MRCVHDCQQWRYGLHLQPGVVFLHCAGPLTAKDYKARLSTSEGTQTIYFPHTNITIRYAFVSQRGYYPDSPDKANQDSLCVHTHFGGDPEQVFFGVFDGHGEYGTQCSQFAKDKVRRFAMLIMYISGAASGAIMQATSCKTKARTASASGHRHPCMRTRSNAR